MSMKYKERISSILLLGLFTFTLRTSLNMPKIPKMLPLFVSIAGMILCATLLIRTFITQYDDAIAAKADDEDGVTIAKKRALRRNVFCAILILVSYVAFMRIIGFYVTSFLFIITLSFLIEGKGRWKWWVYLVVGVGILLIIFGMFDLFLQVPLPKGFLI
jgi:heme A synthase